MKQHSDKGLDHFDIDSPNKVSPRLHKESLVSMQPDSQVVEDVHVQDIDASLPLYDLDASAIRNRASLLGEDK